MFEARDVPQSLTSRLTRTIILTSGLLLFVGIAAAWYIHHLASEISRTLDVDVRSLRVGEELTILIRHVRYVLNLYLRDGDMRHLDDALKQEAALMSWIQQTNDLRFVGSEAAWVRQVTRDAAVVFSQLKQCREEASETERRAIVEHLVNETLTHDVLPVAQQFLDFNEHELNASNARNQTMASRLAIALLVLGISGSMAGLAAGYGVARGVSRSLLQLSIPIRDVAGKLNEVVGEIHVSEDGQLDGLTESLQEISSRVTDVVEQLHARHREVLRAEQFAAMGQLAAGLAHEIRNPLMCMKVLVQSAARRRTRAPLDTNDLQVLDEEISRLEQLLQAFLDFARPPKLQSAPLDLRQTITQTVAFITPRAARRNITIQPDVPEDSMMLLGDEAQIRQVLLNLLLNALDAVPNGGHVWVTLRNTFEQPRQETMDTLHAASWWIELSIADDGRGVSAEHRDRIYEPFYSTKETGLGLGLAICRRIVEAHGGRLSDSDRDGGGTVFVARFPAIASPTRDVDAVPFNVSLRT